MVNDAHSPRQTKNLQAQCNLHEPHCETNRETEYQNLLQTFEALAEVADPVRFAIEFEHEQRRSGLRLTTFKAAYKAWLIQRETGGAS